MDQEKKQKNSTRLSRNQTEKHVPPEQEKYRKVGAEKKRKTQPDKAETKKYKLSCQSKEKNGPRKLTKKLEEMAAGIGASF